VGGRRPRGGFVDDRAMKLALLSDLHANRQALQACLAAMTGMYPPDDLDAARASSSRRYRCPTAPRSLTGSSWRSPCGRAPEYRTIVVRKQWSEGHADASISLSMGMALLRPTPLSARACAQGTEPVPAGSKLLGHPRVILSPHAAFFSVESERELRRKSAQNIVTWLATGRPDYVVTAGTRTPPPPGV